MTTMKLDTSITAGQEFSPHRAVNSGRTFIEALAETLALVPEYATDQAYLVAVFADGHRADLEAAFRAGAEWADAARDDLWRTWASAWSSDAQIALEPDGPEARASAARRVLAAESGCRRAAADHERAFVARAHNTADRDRTDPQRGTVHLYPGASTLRRSA
jgi:hypothetical protein